MRKGDRQLSFATWLRAASMLLILLCHYCAACDVPAVTMLSQIFNIGVQLFFILSGFLVGYKGISRPYTMWYLKRIKRIFVPYWLFLIVLAGVYVAKGLDIFTTDWLLLVLGCQGSVVGVWGAEQTWFVSVLLLCYLLSPVILLFINKVIVNSNYKVATLACLIVCVLPCIYALFEAAWVYTILTPVSLYIIACVLGVRYCADKRAQKTGTPIARLVILVVAALALRFIANVYIDGTIWYDRIIVPYTHMIAACSIFELFEIFFREREVPKVVKLLSDISFEVYLFHYMFTVGPISVFDRVTFWPAACLVVTVLVFGISLLFNKVSTLISNSLSHKAIARKN